MDMIMTLIAGPGGDAALPDCVATIAAALPGAGPPDWLSAGQACDLVLSKGMTTEAAAVARRAIHV